MGKRREMRWVCGEEDTWDPWYPPSSRAAPPPVAMQLSEQGEDATAQLKKRHVGYDQGLTVGYLSWCRGMNGGVCLNGVTCWSAED